MEKLEVAQCDLKLVNSNKKFKFLDRNISFLVEILAQCNVPKEEKNLEPLILIKRIKYDSLLHSRLKVHPKQSLFLESETESRSSIKKESVVNSFRNVFNCFLMYL
jgi:hypothetical protein